MDKLRRCAGVGSLAALRTIALALVSADALADASGDRLLELINAYRTAGAMCEGRQWRPTSPLAHDARLAKTDVDAPSVTGGLEAVGYSASYARVVRLQGPETAESAMKLLRDRYCGAVLEPRLADAAVVHAASTWDVVLAQPLLARQLGDWKGAGTRLLALVNAARAEPRDCGNRRFEAAHALEWNDSLAAAALAHSRDMAKRAYLDHREPDGSEVGDRADREGYRWRHIGENVATGQGSAQQVLTSWLASPQHCANIMDPAFADMGAAYAVSSKSTTGIYWTQVFGARR